MSALVGQLMTMMMIVFPPCREIDDLHELVASR